MITSLQFKQPKQRLDAKMAASSLHGGLMGSKRQSLLRRQGGSGPSPAFTRAGSILLRSHSNTNARSSLVWLMRRAAPTFGLCAHAVAGL
jgi:hypothetical protein